MAAAQSAAGVKYFTLAFVIGSKDGDACKATLNGNMAIDDQNWMAAINKLRGSGGDLIASFGGAAGTELARACTSVDALKAQYKTAIDTLNVTRIDLDIEGDSLDDTAANDRRNQALAALQKEYAAAGKTLAVDYTLPVTPNGLLDNSIALLNSAKSAGLDVTLVNIMTMDYGANTADMGAAAISAAKGLHDQLGQVWSDKSSAQLWAMEGNCPMIGTNDTQNETFTTDNATALAQFANSNGISLLTYWDVDRDNSGSGTPQSDYQFAKILTLTGGAASKHTH
jgi:chitinase